MWKKADSGGHAKLPILLCFSHVVLSIRATVGGTVQGSVAIRQPSFTAKRAPVAKYSARKLTNCQNNNKKPH